MTITTKRSRYISVLLILTLIITGIFAIAPLKDDTYSEAAAQTSYPWSQTSVKTTGDYFVDTYGLPVDNVFENVTTDRLLDILSSNGNYYIFFGGPEHPASQKVISDIDKAAKKAGITKIYQFDPFLDGYQLDITAKGGVADWIGGPSVNFTDDASKADINNRAQVRDVLKLITNLLPASTIAAGGVLNGYTGTTALLYNVKITNRKNVQAGKSVPAKASYALKESNVKSYKSASAIKALAKVFKNGGESSVRSEYDFFKRLYNGSSSRTETMLGNTATADRFGKDVTIFDDKDFPKGAGFVLDSIDIKELYNLLNSGKQFPILFAGQGCHNTQAIIADVARQAKSLKVPVVYVADFALDSNVQFGTGASIDTVLNNSATGGLWIRNSANPDGIIKGQVPAKNGEAAIPAVTGPIYNFSYLYGELTQYLKGWTTENESKKSNSIAYYKNGVIKASSLTQSPFIGGALDTTVSAANRNAVRLQVPFIIRYDGNKALGQRVVAQWLHKNTNTSYSDPGTYTEYMLELSWVRATPQAKADNAPLSWADGLTKVEFADEAVRALGKVLATKNYKKSPNPTITGTAKVGKKLTAKVKAWSPKAAFSYQWFADGKVIKGATKKSFKVTKSVVGKAISVVVTGRANGYNTVSKVSANTGTITKKTTAFTAAPTPVISGKAKTGKTLKVAVGTWSPKPVYSYKWYANGKAIKGATGTTLKLKKAQKGKNITVKVTAKKAKYATATVTSEKTGTVR
jgi:hypothetical protein